jgi:hypothetical protein
MTLESEPRGHEIFFWTTPLRKVAESARKD